MSQTLNFGLPAPFDVQFVGRNQAANHAIAVQLAEQIKKIPGAVDVRVQQPDNWPQFRITVDRSKAAELGLTEQNVANSVLLGLSGSSQVHTGLLAGSAMSAFNISSTCARRNTPWIPCNNSNAMPISASQPGGE